MGRAAAAAERSKMALVAALVEERAARILAEQVGGCLAGWERGWEWGD